MKIQNMRLKGFVYYLINKYVNKRREKHDKTTHTHTHTGAMGIRKH